jgi:O-antigen ligase
MSVGASMSPGGGALPLRRDPAIWVKTADIFAVPIALMWLVHLMRFRGCGLPSRIGLLVVVQNMVSSLFNSHLFDFHEGWKHVLGVAIAGGMVVPASDAAAVPAPARGA